MTLVLVGWAASATAEPEVPAAGEREMTDEEAIAAAGGEVIEVWDERPDKPFDRDTEARLTGEELAALGATDLASALALIPEISVRDVGRGGFNIDIRGARKGAVRILVDGAAVNDPFYGTFDVSTIPITDIVEIRISTAPSSPIDGPGGPGGVVEVHTRDAVGGQLIVARMTSSSLPTFGASATGRTALSEFVAARLSTSATFGLHDFETATGGPVDEGRRSSTGAARVEYRRGKRRAVFDAFVDDRHYLSPPSDELVDNSFLLIDRETSARAGLGYDDSLGADHNLQLQLRGWSHALERRSKGFDDPALTLLRSAEDLWALRVGGNALATRPIGKRARWVSSITVDHERARVETSGGSATTLTRGDATIAELAAGLQVERGRSDADVAVGVAVPMGIGADPWPEAKATATWRPMARLELQAVAARKGRIPSLRERYQGVAANQALGPEHATHGELRLTVRPVAGVELAVAPYYRRTTGTVKLDMATNRFANLGQLDLRGVDTSAKVGLVRWLEVGGTYAFIDAHSDDLCGDAPSCDPLDRLPHHKADGWGRVTPRRGYSVMARARYASRAIDLGAVTPAYVLWELTASAQLGGDWLVVARGEDLLDVKPETRTGYRGTGRVVSLAIQGTWE